MKYLAILVTLVLFSCTERNHDRYDGPGYYQVNLNGNGEVNYKIVSNDSTQIVLNQVFAYDAFDCVIYKDSTDNKTYMNYYGLYNHLVGEPMIVEYID